MRVAQHGLCHTAHEQAAQAALHRDRPLTYARVDLIRDSDGAPRLLELELCEPSLFLAHAEGSAGRLAASIADALARGASAA